ncbi:hypothetical protein [Natronoarchaeum mannanilyticum]|uniref:Tat pathway signal protein n=2 Tax=Natronoarchaeum mannanilyticum TaxID=926360 RepID=A0AAV3T4W8_9EURY
MSEETTRRELLGAAGALAATGAATSVAGCFGGGEGGNDDDDEQADPPAFSLDSWLAAPGEVSGGEHHSVEYFSFEALLAAENSLAEGAYSELVDRTNGNGSAPFPLPSAAGSPIDTFDEYVTVDNNSQQVLYGDHPADAIGEGLVENVGFERAGEHREFELFLREVQNQSANVAIGISEFVLLWVETESPVEGLRTLADTQTDETPLYGDENDDLGAVLDHVGDGDRVLAQTSAEQSETDLDAPVFEGQVGYGYALDLEGDPIDETYAIVFADESSVDVDAVEEWVGQNEGEDGRFAPHTSVSTEQDGRSVLVTGSRETADPFVELFD